MHTRRRFIGSESWPKVEELGPHGSYLFSIRRNRRVVPLLSCARCLVVPEAGGKAHVVGWQQRGAWSRWYRVFHPPQLILLRVAGGGQM